MTNAAQLAAGTPATRDRYVDLLRVVSLGVVVFGHWLMAVIVTGPDGAVRTTNLLTIVPSLQPLTWLLQVMPVFFFVGGFSHATACGVGAPARRPVRRLRPLAGRPAAAADGGVRRRVAGAGAAHRGDRAPTGACCASPPASWRSRCGSWACTSASWRWRRRCCGCTERTGRWAPAVPVALVAAAGLVDVARFAYDVPYDRLPEPGVRVAGRAPGRLPVRRRPAGPPVAAAGADW